jgi:hypothetical protein
MERAPSLKPLPLRKSLKTAYLPYFNTFTAELHNFNGCGIYSLFMAICQQGLKHTLIMPFGHFIDLIIGKIENAAKLFNHGVAN